MWKNTQNEVECPLYYCRATNFKQYLKAITKLYSEDGYWGSGLWDCGYEEWHTYFQTRYIDEEDELYNEEDELPDPSMFKCEEDELGLVPEEYPAILVWNQYESELSIF